MKAKKRFVRLVLLCMMAAALFIFWPFGGYDGAAALSIHFIDVGQGDSIFIRSEPENMNILIDAGENNGRAAGYLLKLGIERLDYVVATHPHSDHIGGLAPILEEFEVSHLLMPDAVHTTVTFEKLVEALEKSTITVHQASGGQVYDFGSFQITILAPNGEQYTEINNYSVVLKVSAGRVDFLLTGDAEEISEKEMLELGYDLSADILKAGHHGSATSGSAAFLQAVGPEVTVISCGGSNSYGHPHKETLTALERIGSAVYRTDCHGTVIIETDGRDYWINFD